MSHRRDLRGLGLSTARLLATPNQAAEILRCSQRLSLTIQPERGCLKVSAQFQLQAVAHPPRTGRARRSSWPRLAFDRAELVLSIRVKPFELQQRKSAAFLRGMGERKNDSLILVVRNSLRRGKLAAVAWADQPEEIAADNRSLRGVIRRNQPLRRRKILGAPAIQIRANSQRTLHRTQHSIAKRSCPPIAPVR